MPHRVEEDQRAAADLLRLRAFLAPDDIPSMVFRDADCELPERLRDLLQDDVGRDRTLQALRSYSLLQRVP